MPIISIGQSDPITSSQTSSGTAGASVSIYGIEGAQGLTQGTNQIVLFISSPSQSSQDANKIDFVVDRFAISGANSNTAMLHVLSPGLPGSIDTKTNEVQVDVSKLTSSVQSASNIELSELKKMMKPGAGSLIVSTTIDTQNIGSSQTTFQLQKMAVITANGKVSSFSMTDMSVNGVYDVSSKKVSMSIPQLSGIARDFLSGASTTGTSSSGVIMPS
ncbi:MAG TPA: hypothetical protein VGK13_01790 [Methanocellaceae archaeon]